MSPEDTQDAEPDTPEIFDDTPGPFNPDLPQAEAAPPEAVAVEPATEPDECVMVNWRGKRFEVVCTQYVDNGNTCICLLDSESGSVEAKATANLSKLPSHRVFIKDYSENRGVAAALVSKGLIRKTGEAIRNGSVTFEQYEIQPKLGSHFNIELPEPYTPPSLDNSLTQAIEGEAGEAVTAEDETPTSDSPYPPAT